MITDQEARAITQWMVDNAPEVARLKGRARFCEARTKRTLAHERLNSDGKTTADREALALTSQAYADAFKAYVKAQELSDAMVQLWKAREAELEFWRTHSANARGIR